MKILYDKYHPMSYLRCNPYQIRKKFNRTQIELTKIATFIHFFKVSLLY